MRLAVVSPFLDRCHGTERCITEQIERLASVFGWEIHVYSQRLKDIADLHSAPPAPAHRPGIFWHKISSIPGPHLFKFLWWFGANQWRRHRDRSRSPQLLELIYSPGINCFDADAIVVHVVFYEFYSRVRRELRLRYLPAGTWLLATHRKLYYHLIMALERRIYSNPHVRLAAVSHLVADQLRVHFQRSDVIVIPNAVDTGKFYPAARLARRSQARHDFGFTTSDFVLLLIGNDWKNKGLDALLRAMELVRDLPVTLLVVGTDDPGLYLPFLRQSRLHDRVRFPPPSPDVTLFYAAADVYAGPSLHDSFALPPLEAMASGLPVITSKYNGGSQVITHGVDGFVLDDPQDTAALALILRQLYQQPDLRESVGEKAAHTAQAYTWDRNARETQAFLTDASRSKGEKNS